MAQMKLIPFMSKRLTTAAFSGLLIIASLGSLAFQGLNLGLDFTGGTLVEIGYEEPADLSVVRSQLRDLGFPEARVQYFGSERDVVIRLQQDDNPELGNELVQELRGDLDQQLTLRRSEFVGPQVGEELRDRGGLGMIIALLAVMVYIAMRFQFKFGVGAVGALMHDVIVVVGIFSIFQLDFDLTVLAALLATIGYSLNDSIVVSDRIRENFRNIRRDDVSYIIDLSLTQMLGRTLVTSGTTALVLLSLLIFGGEMIRMFALALLIGIVVGTYSSIYVTSNLLVQMNLTKQDLARPEKKENDDEPEEIPDWLKDED
ncbi:protein translocase subunit SecF [Natronospirillum operosum]|uniref:Protein-export membrane protein SecF n=1 Tax=Natronospirillum operosum TaxID=2759953 RepID=A0A4Z0WBC3_9GAMM|nr:protein translocase subunit SecF [Natronospirillum operosum]TGG90406.1 protein translocase subunit SecF [Natronospirillum operosum]